MSQLSGKICPFCKTVLTESDDVVRCSACEMPHHKDCWIENAGCTTFGCQGTVSGAGIPPVHGGPPYMPQPGVRFCARCGAQCNAMHAFCARCGSPLAPSAGAFPR
jgi:predicted amidophosphoribosyltransferase